MRFFTKTYRYITVLWRYFNVFITILSIASPEMTPEVITVSFISSKPPSTILAGTSIEYYREEKYNILQAIQRITSDPNFQEILLALYKKNNLGGKPEACSSGRREDGGNDDEASGGGASGGRASGGRSSGGGSSGERAGGSGASGDGTGGTGAGGTYEGGAIRCQYRIGETC